jgi:hypothetical protein
MIFSVSAGMFPEQDIEDMVLNNSLTFTRPTVIAAKAEIPSLPCYMKRFPPARE